MSFLQLSDPDARLLTKLHASAHDLASARQWAEHVKRKRWFRPPWTRGKIYQHQSAYVTAIVVAYGRVFASGRGGYNFPKRLVPYDEVEWGLHRKLLEMRHKVYAHSDLDKWSIRPWHVDGFSTTITGQPANVIAEADLELFLGMIERLLSRISERSAEIIEQYLPERTGTPSRNPVDVAMEAIAELEVGEMLSIRVGPDQDSLD